MSAGRYAPSPTGDLHVGNLRTALLAWLFAQHTGRPLLLRYEDLDAQRTVTGADVTQHHDLTALGITFTGEPLYQSQRSDIYARAVEDLAAKDLVYECFCTRREIQDAAQAPHTPPGAYPGTCRDLTTAQRAERRRDRPPALRLRSGTGDYSVQDLLLGTITATLDDLVLVRNDGAAAYNLAVVVDDHLTGVDQVVRADDLAGSSPRQAHLRSLLYGEEAGAAVTYAHVPLVVNAEGQRLAKRDGAVTASQLFAQGHTAQSLRSTLLASLGLPGTSLEDAAEAFDPNVLPSQPWVFRGLSD